MYIIELIIKFISKHQNKNDVQYFLTGENTTQQEEKCEHVLRPVDSTGMILSCIKCGFVVNMNDNQNEDNL